MKCTVCITWSTFVLFPIMEVSSSIGLLYHSSLLQWEKLVQDWCDKAACASDCNDVSLRGYGSSSFCCASCFVSNEEHNNLWRSSSFRFSLIARFRLFCWNASNRCRNSIVVLECSWASARYSWLSWESSEEELEEEKESTNGIFKHRLLFSLRWLVLRKSLSSLSRCWSVKGKRTKRGSCVGVVLMKFISRKRMNGNFRLNSGKSHAPESNGIVEHMFQ